MRTITLNLTHPDPLALLEQLAPLAPRAPRIAGGTLTIDVDVLGSDGGDAIERVARRVGAVTMKHGSVGRRVLSQAIAGRDRDMLDDAIAFAIGREWIRPVPGGWQGVRVP